MVLRHDTEAKSQPPPSADCTLNYILFLLLLYCYLCEMLIAWLLRVTEYFHFVVLLILFQ